MAWRRPLGADARNIGCVWSLGRWTLCMSGTKSAAFPRCCRMRSFSILRNAFGQSHSPAPRSVAAFGSARSVAAPGFASPTAAFFYHAVSCLSTGRRSTSGFQANSRRARRNRSRLFRLKTVALAVVLRSGAGIRTGADRGSLRPISPCGYSARNRRILNALFVKS